MNLLLLIITAMHALSKHVKYGVLNNVYHNIWKFMFVLLGILNVHFIIQWSDRKIVCVILVSWLHVFIDASCMKRVFIMQNYIESCLLTIVIIINN